MFSSIVNVLDIIKAEGSDGKQRKQANTLLKKVIDLHHLINKNYINIFAELYPTDFSPLDLMVLRSQLDIYNLHLYIVLILLGHQEVILILILFHLFTCIWWT